MAFDAGMMHAVLYEVREKCLDAKVEKIAQPGNDEVNVLLKKNGKTERLVINVGSASPRLSLSAIRRENPVTPPNFCMLLRKHFIGAKLSDVSQAGFERVAFLTFDAFDEMGYTTKKIMAVELMGKYANLIILSEQKKILAAAKYVDFSASSIRQILPGMTYELPPSQNKTDPTAETEEGFREKLCHAAQDTPAEKYLLATYCGTAAQVARDIVYRASGDIHARLYDMDAEAFSAAFFRQMAFLKENRYTPTVYYSDDGVPKEYFYMSPAYFGADADIREKDNFGLLFDDYFGERDRVLRIRERAADLLRLLSHAVSRVEKRLELQREELRAAENGDAYKNAGDMVTANIYRLKKGDASFTATDYTADPPCDVTVTLDTRLSPAQNAQKLYKLYTKAKTARRVLTEQIASGEDELRYLTSVESFLERSETEDDLSEIREELYRAGYASKMKNYTPPKNRKMHFLTAETSGGYKLYCGRNNMQNDYLSFRVAEKGDLWFHAKNIPGSHVILVCGGEEPSAEDYTEAAAFAAFHSKAAQSPLAAVDYTRVKNLKKPSGGKPGLVIYHQNYTAYVEPRNITEKKENHD